MPDFMKNILRLILPIGMVLLLFIFFHGSERAYGAAKSASIGVEEKDKIEQIGPPWLSENWRYRRLVVISNSGASLSYYQVLVKLNNSNYDFSRAKPDGSDVRFTHSDGTTELKFWVESWNNSTQLAYLWVRVPSPGNGDTTVYLYYGNPAASSQSDGQSTFDYFDDNWSYFTSVGFLQNEDTQSSESSTEIGASFSWSIISGTPEVLPPGVLNLGDGTGIKSTTSFQYQAVGFRANFGSGSGKQWGGFINGASGQRTLIRDLPTDVDDLYLSNYVNSSENTILEGVNDWHNAYHIYEVRWNPGWSEGDIDHGGTNASSIAQVPNTPPLLPVTLYSYPGSNSTLMVDWIYVRQYHNPEPTSDVGTEQGLMDLGIGVHDNPDPLRTGVELTYLLTISNTSIIDAPGVVVTDTLPESVQFVRANPSSLCNQVVDNIICSLNTIFANSSGSVSIVVQPTVDGIITNTVTVGSLGYDLDMSNNAGEVTTFVDTVPPNVNWEEPVNYGEKFTTNGGLIPLEASATDNDQVAWVEFWFWNHLPPTGKISIGIDSTYPYQMQLNSEILVPNEEYQVFIQAADRAGNISSIYTFPYQVIYITRILRYFIYLPIVIR